MSEYTANLHTMHGCPKIESLVENKAYAFTFSPPANLLLREGKELLKATQMRTFKLINNLYSLHIKLMPEASPTGRIHYHGTLIIRNIMNFVLIDMPKLQQAGTYYIAEITDPKDWAKYCLKQLTLFQPYCEKNKIRYKVESDNYDHIIDSMVAKTSPLGESSGDYRSPLD